MKIPSFAAILGWLRTLPANEPVILGQGVSMALTAGVSLGLNLSPVQVVAASTAVTTVTGWILRNVVSPAGPTPPPTPPPTPVAQ